MRTKQFFLAALLCMMVSAVSYADDHVISPSQLPRAAQFYIQNHFKGQRIAYAEVDYDHGFKKYEVHLSNGVELKFDARGNCYKVDYDDTYCHHRIQYPQSQIQVRIHYDDDDFDDIFDDLDDLFDD